MTLTQRLALSMIAVAAASVLLAALVAESSLRSATGALEQRVVAEGVDRLANRLDTSLAHIESNLSLVRRGGQLNACLCRASRMDCDASERLFRAALDSEPQYLQLRAIDREGMERLRVERRAAEERVRTVPAESLQDKSHRAYFVDAMELVPETTLITHLELNQERGQIEVPHRPVIRAAQAIFDADDARCGIVIINVDMRPILRLIASSSALAIDEQGRYLANPERGAAFSHELRTDFRRFQDDYPELPSFLPTSRDTDVVEFDRARQTFVAAMARPQLGPPIAIIRVSPTLRARIIGDARTAMAASALLLFAVAATFGLALARSITRPLARVTAAAKAFPNLARTPLPSQGNDEVAILARAFERAAETLRVTTEALERERNLFQIALDESPIGQLVVDAEMRVRLANQAAIALLGYSDSELHGLELERLVPRRARDSHAEWVRGYWQKPERRPVRSNTTLHAVRKDETQVPVEIGLAPVRLDGASVVLVSITDITERERARRLLATMLDSAPAASLLATMEGEIRNTNPSAETLFGFDRGELIGANLASLFAPPLEVLPNDERSLFETLSAALRENSYELLAQRKDGTHVSTLLNAVIVEGPDGPAILVGAQSNAEQRAIRDELRRSNEELARFAYVTSHDLKAPLRGISLAIDWLAEDLADDERPSVHENMQFVKVRAKRLAGLVDGILSYARAQRGPIEVEKLDLEFLVEGVVQDLCRGSPFEFRVEQPLPMVCCARTQLEQVIRNLLDNAMKFHDRKDGRLRISCSSDGIAHRVEVTDDGLGIPEDYRERVFELFTTLQPRDEVESTGLGLTLCKALVERWGGRIGIESAEPRGTRVWFTIPKGSRSGSCE